MAAEKKRALKKVPTAKRTPAVKPSIDAIARAAYLNYRRRLELGPPGNSHSD